MRLALRIISVDNPRGESAKVEGDWPATPTQISFPSFPRKREPRCHSEHVLNRVKESEATKNPGRACLEPFGFAQGKPVEGRSVSFFGLWPQNDKGRGFPFARNDTRT